MLHEIPRYKSYATSIKTRKGVKKFGIHDGASNIVRAIKLESIIDFTNCHPESTSDLFARISKVVQCTVLVVITSEKSKISN